MGFTTKGYGRIYVDRPENVQVVHDEIRAMDAFEYDYLPTDFVAPFSEYPKLKYTHKFDALDLDNLTARLWFKGIHIFCLDNGFSGFVRNPANQSLENDAAVVESQPDRPCDKSKGR